MGVMTDEALELISRWAPRQRWFPAKGVAAQWQLIREYSVAPDVAIVIARVSAQHHHWTLQIPIAVRSAPATDGDVADGEIGRLGSGAVVLDATRSDAVRDLVRTVFGVFASPEIRSNVLTQLDLDHARFRLIAGEQSNTSVIVDGVERPTMVKFFRVIAPGDNPDVAVTEALTRQGGAPVPAMYASLSADWGDGRGHLAVASELVVDAMDAWELVWTNGAQVLVGGATEPQGLDVHGLGSAIAVLHERMATAFGVRPGTAADAAALSDDLIRRLDWARQHSGTALAALSSELDAHRGALRVLPVPRRMQRIHGDLHLGQILAQADGGWRILDFEGEPLRPLAERAEVQPVERDVVGMWRSFAYAAGFAARRSGQERGANGDAWESALIADFTAGYRAAGGTIDEGPLMRALVLDKALYELVYEVRNRPDWVEIPLTQVRALLRD